MEEVVPHKWLLGKITRMNERENKYPYFDFWAKSDGVHAPECRASFPDSLKEGADLTKLFTRLGIKTKDELIGKQIYYKYYEKRDPSDLSHHYRLIHPDDIKTIEEYELENTILNWYKDADRVSIDTNNKLFLDLCNKSKIEIPNALTEKPRYSGGAIMEIRLLKVRYPICEIDLKNFYSNIIITNRFTPQNDSAGQYLKVISTLNKIRQDKQVLGEDITDIQKLKRFNESLIGSLNNENFVFYDPVLFGRIIEEGKRIMGRVLLQIKNLGEEFKDKWTYMQVVRVHTDGIYLRTRKEWCKELIIKLNEILCRSESPYYQFRYEHDYRRAVFKNVNEFVLLNDDEPIKIVGKFFKGYGELVEAFLKGYFPENFSDYEGKKKELLQNKTKNPRKVIEYLRGCKPENGKSNTLTG